MEVTKAVEAVCKRLAKDGLDFIFGSDWPAGASASQSREHISKKPMLILMIANKALCTYTVSHYFLNFPLGGPMWRSRARGCGVCGANLACVRSHTPHQTSITF